MKEARSKIDPANIQEVIDAEQSPEWATMAGQQQYCTPLELAQKLAKDLYDFNPTSILDPQMGEGALITGGIGWRAKRFGIDIDNRSGVYGVECIKSNCVTVFELMDELFPDMRFECVVANPPFGKRLKTGKDGKTIVDSTQYTWDRSLKHGCFGYFIANKVTIERLKLHEHPFVTKYQTFENVWKDCEVVIGVIHWRNPEAKASEPNTLYANFNQIREIIEEEKRDIPPFNIWMGRDGKLKTYLSTRATVKRKIKRDDILKLTKIGDCHPLTLTTERETRKLLNELVDCGFYDIEPKAKQAITEALAEVNTLACPIMPVADFQLVAYADEEDRLLCVQTVNTPRFQFTAGKSYELTTATYSFTQEFKRNRSHYDEESRNTYNLQHECSLSGMDRFIQFVDDRGRAVRFMDRPSKDSATDNDEGLLWSLFKRPEVKTVTEVNPAAVERNRAILRTCEMMAGYEYYPGQLDYLARVAVKDYALIAADTGCGKTLIAISLIALKATSRALIIAPQGTMRSSEGEGDDDEAEEYQASQWVKELNRFAPYLNIFELFSEADYNRILSANGGVLPDGVYVSYYQAMFQNGSRETAPSTWDDEHFSKIYELPLPEHDSGEKDAWTKTIGLEKRGIRCICEPSLSTKVGHHFDMVLLDEAHTCCSPEANVSQLLIRLQPKYRYGLTATPIPNVVSDLFNLLGWLCVPDWYKGDKRNAAWPYAREEGNRFDGTFLSVERDYTEERRKREANKKWRGKVEKASPVISSPARLLKLLTPTMAFISKEACNPKVVPLKTVDIRVPMGEEQAKLYAHFLCRGNVKHRNPKTRAGLQIGILRNICADPANFYTKWGSNYPRVRSNLNPKTLAILELTKEIVVKKGEQVVIVCARKGQNNTIAQKLTEAGIPFSRIDSTCPPSQHAYQSNLFKSGRTRVLLMGIKCAVGHSYPECPNLIIGSLEYSHGSKHQAEGRVWRVNSTKPVTVYCVLHQGTIEEVMFDIVATKTDAATICLHGKRIPKDFKPVDMSEVLATALLNYKGQSQPEEECETIWASFKEQFALAA